MNRIVTAAAVAVLALLLLPAREAGAQMPVTAVGRVVDAQGNPVPDVQVLLDYRGPIPQKYKTKTDKKGVFTHLNVYAGPYRLTLKKEGVGEVTIDANIQEVDSLQKPPEYKFVPKTAAAAPPPPPGSGLAATNAPAPAVNMGQLTAEINNAIALSRSGDTDGAISAYEAILARTPQIPLVQYNLGGLYKKKGDAAKAEAAMRQSVELDPKFVDGYVGLATLLAEAGHRDQAVEAIQKGAAENPDSGRLHYALGVLTESSDPPTAKTAFLKAEQLDPQNVETQYHLATVALNQNDKAEAIARLQRFVAQAPEGTPNVDVARSLITALQKK